MVLRGCSAWPPPATWLLQVYREHKEKFANIAEYYISILCLLQQLGFFCLILLSHSLDYLGYVHKHYCVYFVRLCLNLNEASLKCARLINTLPVEWRWDTLTASSSARIVWVGFERDLMNYNGASPALLSVIWLSGRLNLVIRLIIQMHCCSLHQHSSTMQCSKRAHAHFIMDFSRMKWYILCIIKLELQIFLLFNTLYVICLLDVLSVVFSFFLVSTNENFHFIEFMLF